MKLSIGIVGLPNVGKSTLFNALLKKQVAYAANYPFATIEPNVGVVEVPDERLPVLAQLCKTTKLVPAIVEFYDIAGLVKGAAQGEGLGNKFLSHIREVAAIVQVTRLFEDGDVIHVNNKVDPVSDIQIIEAELILADLETLKKQHSPKQNADKIEFQAYEVIQYLRSEMDKGKTARRVDMTDEQKELIKHLQLMTMKPMFYVFNVSEKQLEDKAGTEAKIREILKQVQDDSGSIQQHDTNTFVYVSAKLENEIVDFSAEEQKEYLNQFGLSETGLNRIIKKAYETLGLISFLTGGELEVRAWTIVKGENAQQASGAIHTDFIKKFIKADIVPYDQFVACNGWVGARDQGKVQIVGKEYIMKDGDVVEFKIGA